MVENPVVRALKTDLLVPVPGSTSYIRDLLNGCLAAFSVLKIVTFIARLTSSKIIESSALIRDWDTNSILVEDPVVRALETCLLVPVPGSTANVRNLLDGG